MYKYKVFNGYSEFVKFLNHQRIKPEQIVVVRTYLNTFNKTIVELVYYDFNEEYMEPEKPGKKLKLKINKVNN